MEENNMTLTEAEDSWDDIDLSDAEVSEDGEPTGAEDSAAAEAESGADQPAEDNGGEPAEASAQKASDADQSVKVKVLGQELEVRREDALRPEFVQKGLDYDRVKSQLEEARNSINGMSAKAQQADEYINFVTAVALQSGMTPEQFMDQTLAGMRAKKDNISVDEARNRMQLEKREAEVRKREEALKAKEPTPEDEAKAAKERRQADFAAFFRARPDVKADSIPKEVFQAVHEGQSLLTAYMSYENKKLRAELDAERQNAKNRDRAAGSAHSDGKSKTDPWDDAWYDGT